MAEEGRAEETDEGGGREGGGGGGTFVEDGGTFAGVRGRASMDSLCLRLRLRLFRSR